MACLPPANTGSLPPANTGIGLQPGRYAAFVLKPIHNIWVYLGLPHPTAGNRRWGTP